MYGFFVHLDEKKTGHCRKVGVGGGLTVLQLQSNPASWAPMHVIQTPHCYGQLFFVSGERKPLHFL